MCGLCLPHCPTFAVSQNESQGPRGRISLMLGIAEGRLAADSSVVEALDNCLTCRACEAACPSLVPYGQLIDESRALLGAQTPRPVADRQPWRLLRNQLFSRRQRMTALWRLAYGLDRLIPAWRRLAGRLTLLLPATLARPFRPSIEHHPPECAPNQPCVGLFIGCMGGSLGAGVSRAAQAVLTRLGFAVWIAPNQTCCGGMHQHGGALTQAENLREQNQTVWAKAPSLSAIVAINTACAAELMRTAHAAPVVELTQFLAELPEDRWPALQPLPAELAVHLPCSQQRVLKQSAATEKLLRRIPGIQLHRLDSNRYCCGAAGMQAVMHPEQAATLRMPVVDEVRALGCAAVSSNIGCAAHLSAGLGKAVLHPVEWIAAALPPIDQPTQGQRS